MAPILLVIADINEEDWIDLCKIYSKQFRVIQANWSQISLVSYKYNEKVQVKIYPLSPKENIINFSPDLVLIRKLPRYIGNRIDSHPDYRNILYGFYHSNTPIINPFSAILCDLERPIMFGRLNKIAKKYGFEHFPLISQYYYPEYSQIFITPNPPIVVKVGFPHSGYGKILIKDSHEMDDLKGIIAMNNTYASIEPYIESEYQIRIIFIAPNYYKVFKCTSMGWKINFGYTNITKLEISMNMKKWCDLIYKNYKDLYMFCIDAVIDKNGKEFIIDVNGSCMELNDDSKKEDLLHMRDLVVRKLESIIEKEIIKNKNDELKNLFNNNIIENENIENNNNEINMKYNIQTENSDENLKTIENIINPSNINNNVIDNINLKNQIEKKENEIEEKNNMIEKIKNEYNKLYDNKVEIEKKNDLHFSVIICIIIILYLSYIIYKNNINLI